jgi:hypothetical protein
MSWPDAQGTARSTAPDGLGPALSSCGRRPDWAWPGGVSAPTRSFRSAEVQGWMVMRP